MTLAALVLALAPVVQTGPPITQVEPQPYPTRVNQPRLRDSSTHGGAPAVAGAGDLVIDGRVALIMRIFLDTSSGSPVPKAGLVAVTLDPDRIQEDAEGNLTEFLDPVVPPPPLLWGDNFAFSGIGDEFVIEESPSSNPSVNPGPTPPVTPGGNLPATNGFAPLALTLKPLPATGPSFGENPYRANASGAFAEQGTFRKYELWMVAVHYTWIWTPGSPGSWGEDNVNFPPILGGRDVTILVDESQSPPAIVSATAGTFTPLTIGATGTALVGHEPTITNDGRLILFHAGGAGNQGQVPGNQWGKVTYAFNATPCSPSGWSAPQSACDMFWLEGDVGGPNYAPTTVGTVQGNPVYFSDLYSMARYPLAEPDGTVYGFGTEVNGPYPWVDPEGDFFVAMHTQTHEAPVEAQATRAGAYAAGAITQGYLKHIDDPALNPTRAGGTMEWPVTPSGLWSGRHTNRLIVTSTGLTPGPWETLVEEDVPVPTQEAGRRIPVLPLISINLDMYGEVRFEEADGNYLLYLAGNEGFRPWAPAPWVWEPDPGFAPDTSGRVPRCTPTLELGAAFPQEYAGGTAAVRAITGAGSGPGDENLGFKGQALMFPTGGRVRVEGCGSDDDELTVQAFVKVLPGWDGPNSLKLVQDPGRFTLRLRGDGSFRGTVTLANGTTKTVTSRSGWVTEAADPWDRTERWRHVALTFLADDGTGHGALQVWIDGAMRRETTFPANPLAPAGVPRSTVWVGPNQEGGSTTPSAAVLMLDEVAISSVVRTEAELRRDAWLPPLPGPFGPWPPELQPLPLGLETEDGKWPAGVAWDYNKFLLGEDLFQSTILSGTGSTAPTWGGVSCATCHEPGNGFAEDQALATSFSGGSLPFNSPTLLGAAFGGPKFFDGRAAQLEEQPGHTIPAPEEMNLPMAEALARLDDPANLTSYGISWKDAFQYFYGGPATEESMAELLMMYVRLQLKGNSPFDQYEAWVRNEPGGADALSAQQKRGRVVFQSVGRCIACHRGSVLSDDDFHNVLSVDVASPVLGHGGFTGRANELGLLKVPTLRNLEDTKPFFHDGQYDGGTPTDALKRVVEHYDRGGGRADGATTLGAADRDLKPLMLTTTDVDALVEFLRAMTAP